MKHLFIVNPAAGKGNKLQKLMESIQAACKAKGQNYSVYSTENRGDALRYVKQECETRGEETLRIYACGGDGTINEVVNGAVGYEGVEIAIVPIGTGNDFIRNFGEKEDFFDLENQMESEAVECDLLHCNDKYCVNMVNIGFDCEVADRMATIRRNPMVPGKFAYVAGLAIEFARLGKVHFHLTVDGVYQGERNLLLSLFANGSFCGGGFRTAPYADVFGGKMDVCFINQVGRLELLSLIGNYKKGDFLLTKNAPRYFEYRKCSEVFLEFDNEQKICVDGEIESCKTLHLKIAKKAIRMVVPKGAVSHYAEIAPSPLVEESV